MDRISIKYNCDKCKHKTICTYSKQNRKSEKRIVEVTLAKDTPFSVDVKCRYYVLETGRRESKFYDSNGEFIKPPSTDTGVK